MVERYDIIYLFGVQSGIIIFFPEWRDINPKFVRDRIARISDELFGAMDDVAAELSDTGHPSPIYKEIATQSQRRLKQLI